MFKQIIVLSTVQDKRPATELNSTPEKILYLFHEPPQVGIELTGKHIEFIRKCVAMVCKWNFLDNPCDSFISEF